MHTYYEGFSQQSNSQWEVNENRYITMSSHDPVHAHMISHVITSKVDQSNYAEWRVHFDEWNFLEESFAWSSNSWQGVNCSP